MGRPIAYERSEVLNNALLTFRDKGYTNTSIKDLESATGLKTGSIYGAFGNKRSFFLETLQDYFTFSVGRLRQDLTHSSTPLTGLKQFFNRTVADVVSGTPECCCYVVKMALEISKNEPEIHEQIQEYFQWVETEFVRALNQSQAIGEVKPNVSTSTFGKLFVITLYGLNVESAVTPKQEKLLAAVDSIFSMIEIEHQLAEAG